MRFVTLLLLSAACLSPAVAVEFCSEPHFAIPNSAPSGVTDSLEITAGDPTPIEDLNVRIEITHTWIGDVTATLSKQGGPSAVLVDQPGAPGLGFFGCSGDDMDAVLNDEAATPLEDECEPGVPSIEGEFIPGDPPGPLLARFEGLDLEGTWELNVLDHGGGDTGSIDRWCLIVNSDDDGGGGDGGTGVPATTAVGAILTILALLLAGAYRLRR